MMLRYSPMRSSSPSGPPSTTRSSASLARPIRSPHLFRYEFSGLVAQVFDPHCYGLAGETRAVKYIPYKSPTVSERVLRTLSPRIDPILLRGPERCGQRQVVD